MRRGPFELALANRDRHLLAVPHGGETARLSGRNDQFVETSLSHHRKHLHDSLNFTLSWYQERWSGNPCFRLAVRHGLRDSL